MQTIPKSGNNVKYALSGTDGFIASVASGDVFDVERSSTSMMV